MPDASRIVATDCGSTTTKAILIERVEGSYRLRGRGEAPTTVEAPFDDVTVGVLNAVGELEEVTGEQFLREGRVGSRGRAMRARTCIYPPPAPGGGCRCWSPAW